MLGTGTLRVVIYAGLAVSNSTGDTSPKLSRIYKSLASSFNVAGGMRMNPEKILWSGGTM